MGDINELIYSEKYHTYILDAAGVLYNRTDGLIPGVVNSVKELQLQGKNIFLLTNNSKQIPELITQKFAENLLSIHYSQIFSSGMGLAYDKTLRSMIESKKVYVIGKPTCHGYILRARPAAITTILNEAQVICLMSASPQDPPEERKAVSAYLSENPDIPIICCNPDNYVAMNGKITQVIGFYAKQIEQDSGRKITWFGKPYPGIYKMTKDILDKTFSITLDEQVCYIDDNPENLLAMKRLAPITTVGITQTGIFSRYAHIDPSQLSCLIDSFGLVQKE